MKKSLKWVLLTMLAAVVVSVSSVNAAAADPPTVNGTLKVGDNQYVLNVKDESFGSTYYGGYYKFIPETSDYYSFSPIGAVNITTALLVYDSDMQLVSGDVLSFYSLQAGKVYYTYVRAESEKKKTITVSVRRGRGSRTLTEGKTTTITLRAFEVEYCTFTAKTTGYYEFYSAKGNYDKLTQSSSEAGYYAAAGVYLDESYVNRGYSASRHDGKNINFSTHVYLEAGQKVWLQLRNLAEVDPGVYTVNVKKMSAQKTLKVGDNKFKLTPGRAIMYKFVPTKTDKYTFRDINNSAYSVVDTSFNPLQYDNTGFYDLTAGSTYYIISDVKDADTTVIVQQNYRKLSQGKNNVSFRKNEITSYVFVPGTNGTYRIYTTGDSTPGFLIFDVDESRLLVSYSTMHVDSKYDLKAGHRYLMNLCVSDGTMYGKAAGSYSLYIYRDFADVPQTASYYNSVCWGTSNDIINGTSANKFSPDDPCTRYQLAVMLYKLAGKPAVSNENLPFKDVKKSASYYKAVSWAYKQGIISGTTKTTFSPNAAITRYQVVQMLYKMAGRPEVSITKNPFKDVHETDSYYKAVLWAAENKITSGTTPTKFSPKAVCKRYQMVVFLNKFNNIYQYK